MTRAPRPLRRPSGKVHAGRQKLKLDEETRWQVAGEAVEELRCYGGSTLRFIFRVASRRA